MQDDITGAIVSALQLTLGADGLAGKKAGRAENAVAHDLYLRGRCLVLKQTEDGLRKSLEYFAKARSILSEFLKRSERQYVSPDEIALIYASLGEMDQAFA